jgi:DNA-binding transcriptional MerR regulator
MEYLIEELAVHVGLPVDTIRFYQSNGLLHPPTRRGRRVIYDQTHVKKIEKIRDLQKKGFSLKLIRRVLNTTPPDLAYFGFQEDNLIQLSLEDLSNKTGLDLDLLRQLENMGILIKRFNSPDKPYDNTACDMLTAATRIIQAGIPPSELLSLAKTYAENAKSTAMDATRLFNMFVRKPLIESPLSEQEKSEKLIETLNILLDAATTLTSKYFQSCLIRAAEELAN